jgi:predicted dehydrogenase
VLTRHQHHARQVLAALKAGRNVYCEKPLAMTTEDLDAIFTELKNGSAGMLSVGFNRRFSPLSIRLKSFLSACNEPFMATYRVNAGFIPATHWTHDPAQGGGRIVGEGCHFIDYMVFLAGATPVKVDAEALPDSGRYHSDNVQISLKFPNGSLAQVIYLANGDKGLPKERLEVHSGGQSAILEDYRELQLWSGGIKRVTRSVLRQDKGHQAAWQAFVEAIKAGTAPSIPYDQIYASSLVAIQAAAQVNGQG